MSSDDPLERLAAEENWERQLRDAEKQAARDRRKQQRRNWLKPSRGKRSGQAISRIFLAIVAVLIASGVVLWTDLVPPKAAVFIFVLSAWLVTLCFHEFAHALAAHRGGDDTVVDKGYLTLDPRKYGHPVLTLVLPLIILVMGGLPLPGGAVMIESHRLRNRFRDSLVSLAGPMVNVAAAFLLLIILAVLGPVWIENLDESHAAFWSALTFLAYLQVAAALLNLLPIPGLDGYGIIEPYLPSSTRYSLGKVKPYGILIVFGLLYIPFFRNAFSEASYSFLDLFGAPVNGYYFGYTSFQFWKGW